MFFLGKRSHTTRDATEQNPGTTPVTDAQDVSAHCTNCSLCITYEPWRPDKDFEAEIQIHFKSVSESDRWWVSLWASSSSDRSDSDLVEAAVEELLDLWTLKGHRLKLSFVVVVEERQSLSSVCRETHKLKLPPQNKTYTEHTK